MSWFKRNYSIIFPLLLAIGIISAPQTAVESATLGLNIFWSAVLPSLFPFMVCTNILINSRLVDVLDTYFSSFMRPIFNLSGVVFIALLSSLLAGYPMGAQSVAILYENEKLPKEQAQRAALLCSTCGPVFIIATIGAAFLGDVKAGIIIVLCHWAAVLSNGIIDGLLVDKTSGFYNPSKTRANHGGGNPITSSILSILHVGGYIVLYSTAIGIIKHYSLLNVLSNPLYLLGIESYITSSILEGALEMATGIASIASRGTSPLICAIICAIVSFGGLSIHGQSMSFLEVTGLTKKAFTFAKLKHSVTGFLFCYIVYSLISNSATITSLFLPIALIILIFASILLFKAYGKKHFTGF